MLITATVLLLLLFLFLAFMPLTLEVKCRYKGLKGEWQLGLSTWFGLRFALYPTRRTAGLKPRSKEKKFPPLLQRLLRRKGFGPALAFLLKRVDICRLEWCTEIGFGDPAFTGISVGGLWSLKGFILTLLNSLLPRFSCLPRIEVVPCFTRAGFDLWVCCVFTTRVGYILLAILKAGKR